MTKREISEYILDNMDELVEEIVERIKKSEESLPVESEKMYEKLGQKKTAIGISFTLKYLSESILTETNKAFLKSIKWTRTLFKFLQLPSERLKDNLMITKDVLKGRLSDEAMLVIDEKFSEVESVFSSDLETRPSFLESANPNADVAKDYLNKVLSKDRQGARDLILEQVKSGMSVRDVYLNVFEPAQKEVGRLWLTHQISVADEHYCTAITQSIIAELYPYIINSEKNGLKLLSLCVVEELHEIGIRMVTDFFEMEGWDTRFIGANAPTSGVLSTIEEFNPDVVAISVTIPAHINTAVDLIEKIRETSSRVKIIVGGYTFILDDDLWKKCGADGFAKNAQESIVLANKLVKEGD